MSRPTINLCACESSRIAAHGYDASTRTLALQFKRKGENGEMVPGTVYHYSGFEPEAYAELCAAESIGKFFGARVNVKDDEGNLKYPFIRIEQEETPA